jgi:hypothetical protein
MSFEFASLRVETTERAVPSITGIKDVYVSWSLLLI